MRIDLYKYIRNWLPFAMRGSTVVEFLRVLLSRLPRAHNSFEIFAQKAKYKASANASVISLQHNIERSFDVKAKITELDGKPTDFLVSIDGYVDEYELTAFIDRYKLAGKSYVFRQGEVQLTAKWINHVCEDIREVLTAKWIEYTCESDRKVYIYVSVIPNPSNDRWLVNISADRAVQSELRISVKATVFNIEDMTDVSQLSHIATLPRLSRSVVEETSYGIFGGQAVRVESVDITPNSDTYFEYINK